MYVSQMKIEIVLIFKKNITDNVISCEIYWWLLSMREVMCTIDHALTPFLLFSKIKLCM